MHHNRINSGVNAIELTYYINKDSYPMKGVLLMLETKPTFTREKVQCSRGPNITLMVSLPM